MKRILKGFDIKNYSYEVIKIDIENDKIYYKIIKNNNFKILKLFDYLI